MLDPEIIAAARAAIADLIEYAPNEDLAARSLDTFARVMEAAGAYEAGQLAREALAERVFGDPRDLPPVAPIGEV